MEREAQQFLVYVGTYTHGRSEGIYVYRLDLATGALQPAANPARADNPSYLALHPQGRYLYAVDEGDEHSSAVRAFAVDPATGALSALNRQPSPGAGPCYVSLDRTGRLALAANYESGSVAAFPVLADGRLGPASCSIQHRGSSVDPQRQAGPHAHCILPDPGNRYALAADLGLDRVLVYRLDLAAGKLVPHREPWVQVRPGAGPRHLAFHPNGRHVYLMNELDCTVVAFAYDGARGTLRELQTLPALPPGPAAPSSGADIHLSPSGAFVYASLRGADLITIFAVEEGTGRLAPLGHEPTRGRTPRNFSLDPTGSWLLAANQDSDTIVTFKIDPQTGRLTPTGQVTEVPAPVCIKMLQL